MFAKINNASHNPSLIRTTGGSMVIQYYGGEWEVGNEPTPVIQVPHTIQADRWYHVALTRDASNNLRLFVDGEQKGATSANYTTDFTDADYFLGNITNTGGSSRSLKGFLDEVRITVGQARYTANFTPMTTASGNKSS